MVGDIEQDGMWGPFQPKPLYGPTSDGTKCLAEGFKGIGALDN